MGARRARSTSFGPSAPGDRDLAGRRARVKRRLRDRLDLGVEEGPDQGSPEQRSGWLVEQRMGGRVGADDPGAVADREDALSKRLDERVAILGVARPADLERLGPRREVPDRCDRVAVGPHADRLADRTHRASVACGERRDDDERDERPDRRKPCLHGPSIAQGRTAPHAAGGPVGAGPAGGRVRPAGRRAGNGAARAA